MFGLILTSATVPGCGCILTCVHSNNIASIWKFIPAAQELLLLSLISATGVSTSLVRTFRALGFANFALFAPMFSALPAELQGESRHEAMPEDWLQYHPSLQAKTFLVTAKCHACFAAVSILALVACVVLQRRSEYFRKMRQAYLFCGAAFSVQACLVDIVLCVVVQFTDVYNMGSFSIL